MKKTLMSLAMTATLTLGAVSAHAALLPFTIDETQLGVGSKVTTGIGKLNGGYTETLTVNVDFTFDATAYATLGLLYDVNGTLMPAFGSGDVTDLNQTYGLYAVFNSSGVVSGPTSFTGLTGSFDLFIDKNGDSAGVFGATGDIGVTVSNNVDDIKLASSTNLTFAQGVGVGSSSTSFKFLFDDLSLTTEGADFFVSPNPFYLVVNVNGDFDDGLGVAVGTYAGVLGDVSAQFEVPEPGSLALLGLGLAGLGLAKQRRRKTAK